MHTWIWALTFTVLGPVPEHGSLVKYSSRTECEQALVALKQQKKTENKAIVGTCTQRLVETHPKNTK